MWVCIRVPVQATSHTGSEKVKTQIKFAHIIVVCCTHLILCVHLKVWHILHILHIHVYTYMCTHTHVCVHSVHVIKLSLGTHLYTTCTCNLILHVHVFYYDLINQKIKKMERNCFYVTQIALLQAPHRRFT